MTPALVDVLLRSSQKCQTPIGRRKNCKLDYLRRELSSCVGSGPTLADGVEFSMPEALKLGTTTLDQLRVQDTSGQDLFSLMAQLKSLSDG